MAKKVDRSLKKHGQSQRQVESETSKKFSDTADLAQTKPLKAAESIPTKGRISPQISCTVQPEDLQQLNEIALYASNKLGRVLNTSKIVRALIRLGHERKEDLEF